MSDSSTWCPFEPGWLQDHWWCHQPPSHRGYSGKERHIFLWKFRLLLLLLLFSCKSLQEWATDCKETMVDDSNDGEAPASSSDVLFADYDPVTQYPPPGFKWWHGDLVPLTPEESQLLKEHLHPESVKNGNQVGKIDVFWCLPCTTRADGRNWIASVHFSQATTALGFRFYV